MGSDAIEEKEFSVSGEGVKICGEYFSVWSWAYWIQQSTAYFIMGFKFGFQWFIQNLIARIGFKTESKMYRENMIVLFVCYFFSTSFIILLVDAEMSE